MKNFDYLSKNGKGSIRKYVTKSRFLCKILIEYGKLGGLTKELNFLTKKWKLLFQNKFLVLILCKR